MKDLTSSVFTFEDFIQGNFLYVDKTDYIWNLIRPKKAGYFLSRPRRFGKSLLISTLKAIFEGKKELFKGLAINNKPYDWKPYPVIHLSLGDYNVVSDAMQELPGYLMSKIRALANMHSIALSETTPGMCLGEIIDKLAEKEKVVILIDEYDKPILSNISDAKIKDILKCLKGFYGVLKDRNDKERLLFVTGVSKFCHVSLFSELNNLTDITLNQKYAGMLGFTADEIRRYFSDCLPDASMANGLDAKEFMARLLQWYDGYRFSDADIHVCNPVSIMNFFQDSYKFTNYWGTTGASTVLFELAKKTRFNFEQALADPVSALAFGAYDVENIDPLGLLWQTGYITIKEVLPGPLGSSMYRLGFPNLEVEQSFNTQLLAYYSGYKDSAMSSVAFKLTEAIRQENAELFMKTLQAYFANIPYDIHDGDEHYYQTIFFITFMLLGCFIEAESHTNEGRIDAYIRTANAVYIFEFKLNKSSRKAFSQIIDRHYYEKFQNDGLPIHLIGVNFNSSKGRINGWTEMKQPKQPS